MKLTREGAARLGRYESRGFPVGEFEFKPEDFDGCCQNGNDHLVCLTVKEAKQIDAAMTYLYMNSDIGRRYADVINKLLCRIKQAEGK